MIGEDIELAAVLFDEANTHPELEAITHSLSITTFRYVPHIEIQDNEKRESYINALNEQVLKELQQAGELFLSNAVVTGKYCLRACIVNFRTSRKDIGEIVEIVVREGRKIHTGLQR
jgi:glutamate/tyrosine decarboxylase-like PLP-dependent enzyme